MTFSHAASLFSLSPHALTNRDLSELSAHQTLGQAKVSAGVNVITGDLWVKDHVHHFPDVGGAVEFAYVYCRERWRLCAGLQLEISKDKQRLGLLTADGKYLTAQWNEAVQRFEVADGLGMYQIMFDAETDQYVCYHTGTRVSTYLSREGRILKQKNALGHVTEFDYVTDGFIIKAPSGACYEFIHEMPKTYVYRDKILIHTYVFNDKNLVTSETPDGYKIEYGYHVNQLLETITQTDTTKLQFCYTDTCVSGVEVGTENPARWIISSPNEHSRRVEYPSCHVAVLGLDHKNQIDSIIQNHRNLSYHTNPAGLIDCISYPDRSFEKFIYDHKTGLLIAHFKRDGGLISYKYSEDDNPVLLAETLIFQNEIVDSKQYIYNIDPLTRVKYLTYEVSLGGAVCKYDRDALGQVTTISRFTKHLEANLDNLNEWCVEMTSYAVKTHLSYLDGQLHTQKQYTSFKKFEHDAKGNLLNSKTLISEIGNVSLMARQQVDALNRLKLKVFGENTTKKQATSIEYNANLINKAIANGRLIDSKLNACGKIIEEIQRASVLGDESRRTEIQYFDECHLTVYTHPDASETYEYKDDLDRTVCEINGLGECIRHEYNDVGRYCIKTIFAKTLEMNIEKAKQGMVFPVGSCDDRIITSFFGLNEKLRYLVDALGYVTEYRYNGRGQQTHVIRYLEAVTAEELDLLKSGKDWKRVPNRETDRIDSTFYDDDGHIIAEQDAAGYVTKYMVDALGRDVKKTVYFKPDLLFTDQLEKLKIDERDKNNAISTRRYDGLNQCNYEINAEGYALSRGYTADGKLDWERKHHNRPHGNFPPVDDIKDQVDHYVYDDLRRLIEIHKSTGEVIEYTHDEMDQPTSVIHRDTKFAHRRDGDHWRAVFQRYDKWEQCIASINPFVAMRLAELQDEGQKTALWKEHAEHFEYNATGLKTKSIDALGNVTLHYYDVVGHEVLRIDPTGAAIQWTYNSFGELTNEHQYYQRIAKEALANMKGGKISADVLAVLDEDEANDKYLERKFDARGLVYEVVENKKRVTKHQYNAFKEVEKTVLPAVQGASATLEFKHEQRGKVTETKRSAPNMPTYITTAEYKHPLALKTAENNAVGGRTEWQHNKLGEVTGRKLRDEDGEMKQFETIHRDVFGRIKELIDADKRSISIEYSVDGLTETWCYPDSSKKEFIHNIFGEVVVAKILSPKGDVLSQESFSYAPDGQVASKNDGLNQAFQHKFNDAGLRKSTTFPEGFKHKFRYNGAHVCEHEAHQGANKATSMAFGIDAFGRQDSIVDALNHIKTKRFDAFDNVRQQTEVMKLDEPNLEKFSTTDSSGYVDRLVQGDSDRINQQMIDQQRDAYNRLTSSVVDPNGLRLAHSNQYDGLDRIVRSVDPEGYIRQSWHNVRDLLRFKLTPLTRTHSQLLEFRYSPAGKLIERRLHRFPVNVADITENTTLEDLKRLYPGKESDQITKYILDDNGNPKFKIKLIYEKEGLYKAIISERHIDAAGRVAFVSRYAKMPLLRSPDEITNEHLKKTTLEHALCENKNDKATYYFYNAASQKEMIVDQSGYLVVQLHDVKGRVIGKRYYNKPVENFESQRPLIPENATYRCQHFIFDDFGNEIAQISADGTVIIKRYDDNNNHIMTCRFFLKINPNQSYASICDEVAKMEPDPDKDSITGSIFDNADRLITTIDAKQCKDHYKLNAFGNIEAHTNRNGFTTLNGFDKAQRKVSETSPEVNIAEVYRREDGSLAHVESRKKICKLFEVDGNNNITAITDGAGLYNERKVCMTHAANGEIIGTEIKNVNVHGSKEKVTVNTEIILDAMGKKIAERDEAGVWSFYIRDSLGRVIYKVFKETSVEYYEYNALGKKEVIKKYATPFVSADLTIFTDPLRVLDAMECMRNYPVLPADRISRNIFNREGNIVSTIGGLTPWYHDNKYGVASPVTDKEYNIHQELIYERKLVAPDVWVESAIWRDDSGRPILTIDELGFATEYQYNSMGLEEVRSEYSQVQIKFIDLRNLCRQPIDVVKELIDTSKLDRIYVKKYDQRGDIIDDALLDVKFYKLEFTGAMMKGLVKNLLKSKNKEYQYTNTQKIKSISDNEGLLEERKYDERDFKVDTIGAERTKDEFDGNKKKVIPLTRKLPDAFGAISVTHTHKDGGVRDADGNVDFVSNSDMYTSRVFSDNRGLGAITEDAERNQAHYTFTATGKEASKTILKQWFKSPKLLTTIKAVWEKVYNPSGQVSALYQFLGDKLEQVKHTLWNVFGEVSAEGPTSCAKDAWQTHINGKVFNDNFDKGRPSIHLRNLLGHETLRLTSDTLDLSNIKPEEIPGLLDMPNDVIQRQSMNPDPHGNIRAYRSKKNMREGKALPTSTSEVDRWNNVVASANSSGDTTKTKFNKTDQLSSITKPEVEVFRNGKSQGRKQPKTKLRRNLRDGVVAKISPSGNAEYYRLDEVNQILEHILADGVREERIVWDTLQRPIMIWNSLNGKYTYKFNGNDLVVSITLPMGGEVFYKYDAANDCVSVTTPDRSEHRMNHSSAGDVIERFRNAVLITKQVYDRNHLLINEENSDGTKLANKRDWFSNVTGKTDMMGREHLLDLDQNMQVKSERTVGGHQLDALRFTHGVMHPDGAQKPYMVSRGHGAINANLEHFYKDGYLHITIDVSNNRLIERSYNDDGKPEELKIYQLDDMKLLRHVTQTYDKLGRKDEVIDRNNIINDAICECKVKYFYDENDNVVDRLFEFKKPTYSPKCEAFPKGSHCYNTFDVADRALVTNGIMNGDKVVPGFARGRGYAYNKGVRVSEAYDESVSTHRQSDIVHDDDKFISFVHNNNGLYDWRTRDRASRLLNEHKLENGPEHQTDPGHKKVITTKKITEQSVSHEFSDNRGEGASGTVTDSLSVIGNVTSSHTELHSKEGKFNTNTTISYFGKESLSVYQTKGRLQNKHGRSEGNAQFLVDHNCDVIAKTASDDEVMLRGKDPMWHLAVMDRCGDIILGKYYLDTSPENGSNHKAVIKGGQMPVIDIDGNVEAAFTFTVDGANALDDKQFHNGVKGCHHQEITMSGLHPYSGAILREATYVFSDGVTDPTSSEFENAPVPQGIQEYFVRPGDTVESIAKYMCHDVRAAADIRRENGLFGNFKLAPGSLIRLPYYSTSSLSNSAAMPYSMFAHKIIGHLSPHLQTPAPKVHHPGFFSQFVKMLALALVVGFAPVLAGILLGTGAGLLAVTGVSAVIAGLGDAAVQGLAMVAGIQEKFSVPEVLETAITSAVAGGVDFSGGISPEIVGRNVLHVATAQVSTQLTEMAVGIRQHFSVQDIGVQVVAALAGGAINQSLGKVVDTSSVHGKVAAHAAVATSNGVVNGAAHHTGLSPQQIAANAICSLAASNATQRLESHFKQASITNDIELVKGLKIDRPGLPADLTQKVKAGLGEANQRGMSAATSTLGIMRAFGDGVVGELKSQVSMVAQGFNEFRSHPIAFVAKHDVETVTSAFALEKSMLGRGFSKNVGQGVASGIDEFGRADANNRARMFGKGAVNVTEAALAAVVLKRVPIGAAVDLSGGSVAESGVAERVGVSLTSQLEKAAIVKAAENLTVLPEKTIRFIKLATGASRGEVRAILKNSEQMGITKPQLQKIKDILGSGRMDEITVKKMQSGDLRIAAERGGRTSGYQRMSFEINLKGQTTKVVQTAFEDSNTLVRQRPGEIKNNLYDVKKWKNKI